MTQTTEINPFSMLEGSVLGVERFVIEPPKIPKLDANGQKIPLIDPATGEQRIFKANNGKKYPMSEKIFDTDGEPIIYLSDSNNRIGLSPRQFGMLVLTGRDLIQSRDWKKLGHQMDKKARQAEQAYDKLLQEQS